MRRRQTPPLVTVYGCSAHISLRSQIPLGYYIATYQVTPDEAHALIAAPYILVTATSVGGWPGTTRRVLYETAWTVHVVALIEDEAYEAAEKTIDRLRRDIAAGPIEKGTHSQHAPRNPLEPAEERELRAYHAQVLRGLENLR